jgi:hypothetical protein
MKFSELRAETCSKLQKIITVATEKNPGELKRHVRAVVAHLVQFSIGKTSTHSRNTFPLSTQENTEPHGSSALSYLPLPSFSLLLEDADEEENKALEVLEQLVLKNSAVVEAVAKLDPFPELPMFSKINKVTFPRFLSPFLTITNRNLSNCEESKACYLKLNDF